MLANKLLDSGGWDIVRKRGIDVIIQRGMEQGRSDKPFWTWLFHHFSTYDSIPSEQAYEAFLRDQWKKENKQGKDSNYEFERSPGIFTDPIELYCDRVADWHRTGEIGHLGIAIANNAVDGKEREILQLLDELRTTIQRTTENPFQVVRASELKVRDFDWLWKPYIAFGELTLLVGDPKLGKSVLTMELAAKTTTGDALPGEVFPGKAQPYNVLLVTNEDHPERVILPRLKAARADVQRVHVFKVGSDLPTLPSGIDWIHSFSEDHDVGLVILDPLDRLWDDHINPYRGTDVKKGLGRLGEMAHATDIAVLVVHHLNKIPGSTPIQRLSGAIAIAGTGRSILLMGKHPDDRTRRVLANAGGNYAPEGEIMSLVFRLDNDPMWNHPITHWEGAVELEAEDLLTKKSQKEDEQVDKMELAKRIITTMLVENNNEVKKSEIVDQGKFERISERTIERAKDELGNIKVKRVPIPGKPGPGFAVWYC